MSSSAGPAGAGAGHWSLALLNEHAGAGENVIDGISLSLLMNSLWCIQELHRVELIHANMNDAMLRRSAPSAPFCQVFHYAKCSSVPQCSITPLNATVFRYAVPQGPLGNAQMTSAEIQVTIVDRIDRFHSTACATMPNTVGVPVTKRIAKRMRDNMRACEEEELEEKMKGEKILKKEDKKALPLADSGEGSLYKAN